MRLLTITLWILILCQFGTFANDTKSQKETQDEIDLREFREYKKKKEKQREVGLGEKEVFGSWYLFFQGGKGLAETLYENGKMQFGKAGFEYRMNSSFGIGFSVGNNSLDLRSKNICTSLALAYLLVSAYNATQSGSAESMQANQIQFAKVLDSPVAYFYLSNVFNYRYNTAQVDFNFHYNKDRFFDPYIGMGIISGSCTGTYACIISGGELKLGAQLNMESIFTFFQLQRQIIYIKEPDFASFKSQHSIASMGVGKRF